MPPRENGRDEPVIRDNRKIDPETGQVRETSADQAAGQPAAQAPGTSSPDGELAAQLAERTADLQRLQAEYVNYRRRVQRDQAAVREQAVAGALMELLPVLDDIGRARDHGELTGGFAKVAESLEAAVTKLGLSAYGQKGEPFDPTVHEALMHSYSTDVTEPTAIEVLQPGYRMGDRVLRPARVAVAEPAEPDDVPAASNGEAQSEEDN
jgi:molecular chaperone GrpE